MSSETEKCSDCRRMTVMNHLLNVSQKYFTLCCECADRLTAHLGRRQAPAAPATEAAAPGQQPEDTGAKLS